ncbi:MAG: hypothetical protein ACI9JP_003676, partial [Granulosicoccus sp.]
VNWPKSTFLRSRLRNRVEIVGSLRNIGEIIIRQKATVARRITGSNFMSTA